MYKLAIVDDEVLARACLIKLLDMESLGISSYIEARSGRDALEKFKTFTPEIMLVDVRMPGMDGLTLVKTVQERINVQVKPIIVSCYNDFSYSREAMQLKAYDYILKPVRKCDLVNAIKKAVQELEKERLEQQTHQQLADRLQESILSSFLDQKTTNEELLHSLMSAHQDKHYFAAIVIRIIDAAGNDLQTLENSIRSTLTKALLHNEMFWVVHMAENLFTILLSAATSIKTANITKNLIDVLSDRTVHFSIGIGTPQNSYKGLVQSYNQAVKASLEFLITGYDTGYCFEEIMETKNVSSSRLNITDKDILDCIRIGSNDYFVQLRMVFDPKDFITFCQWKRTMHCFLLSLQQEFYEHDIHRDLLEEFNGILNDCSAISDILQWLDETIQPLLQHINRKRLGNCTENMHTAIDYIKNHYADEDISLEFIASLMHMNTTYFCEVFKKYTHNTFIEFLTNIRIEKAKELLSNTPLKIYEVAQQVGYRNANYFTSRFKRHTGVEPKKFRGANQ